MQTILSLTEVSGALLKEGAGKVAPCLLKQEPFKADLQVLNLLAAFERATLPRAQWTHGAHLTVAAALLQEAQGQLPLRQMAAMVRAYNEACGMANTDSEGYHATITEAFLRAVAHFLAGLPSGLPLFEKCNRLRVSALADKHWLLRHWSRQTLFSIEARRSWVSPDLLPLPF